MSPVFPYTSPPAVLRLLFSMTDSVGHHYNRFLVNMFHSPSLSFWLIPSYQPTPAVVITTNVCSALALGMHCSQCLARINLFSCINWHLPASSISDPEKKFYRVKDQYDYRFGILLSLSSFLALHKEFTCFICSLILSKLHPFHPPSCFYKILHFIRKLEDTGTRKSSLSATNLQAWLHLTHTLLSLCDNQGRESPPCRLILPLGLCTHCGLCKCSSFLSSRMPPPTHII